MLSICVISVVVLFALAVSPVSLGFYFLMHDIDYFIEWEVLTLNSGVIVITILFDWIALISICVVLFFSSLAIFIEKSIAGNQNISRFIIWVLIFVISIIFLITSPNLTRVLLWWDGLGLVSNILVMYYQNVKYFNAGVITSLCNRIGDAAFLLPLAWILHFGSLSFRMYKR